MTWCGQIVVVTRCGRTMKSKWKSAGDAEEREQTDGKLLNQRMTPRISKQDDHAQRSCFLTKRDHHSKTTKTADDSEGTESQRDSNQGSNIAKESPRCRGSIAAALLGRRALADAKTDPARERVRAKRRARECEDSWQRREELHSGVHKSNMCASRAAQKEFQRCKKEFRRTRWI